jgi:hypothetical protein
MTALPIAAPFPLVMKILAAFPIILATILWPGPGAEKAGHSEVLRVVTAVSCHAFEPTFYYMGCEGQGRAIGEIFKMEEEADGLLDLSMLTLSECRQVIDSGTRLPSARQSNHPLIPYFLHRGKSNGLLVVGVSAVVAYEHPVDLIDAVKKYGYDSGYKRVLILGGHCAGVTVVYDSTYEKQHENASGR